MSRHRANWYLEHRNDTHTDLCWADWFHTRTSRVTSYRFEAFLYSGHWKNKQTNTLRNLSQSATTRTKPLLRKPSSIDQIPSDPSICCFSYKSRKLHHKLLQTIAETQRLQIEHGGSEHWTRKISCEKKGSSSSTNSNNNRRRTSTIVDKHCLTYWMWIASLVCGNVATNTWRWAFE